MNQLAKKLPADPTDKVALRRLNDKAKAKDKRVTKTLQGICLYCDQPALKDSAYCSAHHEKRKQQRKERYQRKKFRKVMDESFARNISLTQTVYARS